MSDDYLTEPARSRWHDGVEIGARLSAQPLLDHPMIGFEGDLRMSPLEPMLVPELPRSGEVDPTECRHCERGADQWIWRDEHWHVSGAHETGLPWMGGLAPNAHFHMAFMARPLGMMQARGYMLAVWDDVLPRTDPELVAENNAKVAAAMARRGGTALV